MKRVNDVFQSIGIVAYADTWRPTDVRLQPPSEYVVYVTLTVEDEHSDDVVQAIKTFVYMNLWSAGDPTPAAKRIRQAMRNAGFAMDEERTGASSGESKYAPNARRHCVSWTWVYWESVADGV